MEALIKWYGADGAARALSARGDDREWYLEDLRKPTYPEYAAATRAARVELEAYYGSHQ